MTISRRRLLQIMSLAGFTPSLACAHRSLVSLASSVGHEPLPPKTFADISPLNRTIAPLGKSYLGDNPNEFHRILWDKAGFLSAHGGQWPAPSRKVKVAVVGGGMSGIIASYLLRDLSPLLIEREPRLGGNSQGESWRGVDYSIGAAYIAQPEPNSPIEQMLKDVGAFDVLRTLQHESQETTLINSTLYSHFWEGTSDPKAKHQFEKLERLLDAVFTSRDGEAYPEMPVTSEERRKIVDHYDQFSLGEFIETRLAAPLHPHLRSALEIYCWSALGAGLYELSAASGLNFLAAEFAPLMYAKGGNAAVAEKIMLAAMSGSGRADVLSSQLVIDVRQVGDRVHIACTDGNDLRVIEAEAAVMCCPSVIAKKLIDDLSPERQAMADELSTSGQIVANILSKGRPNSNLYAIALLGDGEMHGDSTEERSRRKRTTDIVVTASAAGDGPKLVALTAYRPLSYPGSRAELLAPDSWQRFEKDFREQLSAEVFPVLGLHASDIQEIRISRWGHALPVARPGFYQKRGPESLSRPHGERVFFAHHDMWALPAFEACFAVAQQAELDVRRLV